MDSRFGLGFALGAGFALIAPRFFRSLGVSSTYNVKSEMDGVSEKDRTLRKAEVSDF